MPRIILDDVNQRLNKVSRKIEEVRQSLHEKSKQEQSEDIRNAKPIQREFQELCAKQNLWSIAIQVRSGYDGGFEGIRFSVSGKHLLEGEIHDGILYHNTLISYTAKKGIAKTVRAMRNLAGITKENTSGNIEVSLEGVDYDFRVTEIRKPHNSLFEYRSSSDKLEADRYSLEVRLVRKPQAAVLVA